MKYGREIVIGTLMVFVFILGLGIQAEISRAHEDNMRAALIAQLGTLQEEIEVVKIQSARSIEEVLAASSKDQQELLDQIVTLNEDITELRYIVTTNGTLQGTVPEPIIVEQGTLPPNHRYQLGELTVAEFKVTELGDQVQYEFPSYDVEFETSIVIGEKSVAVDVLAWSAFDPEQRIRIAQDSQAFDLYDETPLIGLEVGLGVTSSYPQPEPAGSLWLSWLHPHENIDVGNIRLSGNSQELSLGLDVASYNLGAPIPVLNNLWLSAGASLTSTAQIKPSLTIGAKL